MCVCIVFSYAVKNIPSVATHTKSTLLTICAVFIFVRGRIRSLKRYQQGQIWSFYEQLCVLSLHPERFRCICKQRACTENRGRSKHDTLSFRVPIHVSYISSYVPDSAGDVLEISHLINIESHIY